MTDTTIIYYTDNHLDEPILSLCRKELIKSANGHPIISVSQKPITLGQNICVGKKKRSWISIYEQILKGVENSNTKNVAMAEHDCLYSKEHMAWTPPDDETFYYNENHWLLDWRDSHPHRKGIYSRFWKDRYALSQMICNRELLKWCLQSRLALLDKDKDLLRTILFIGEPGISELDVKKADHWAKSGKPVYLSKYLKRQLDREKWATFRTKAPNIDIKHGKNFTGPKRGKKSTYSIPYWGKFADLVGKTD